MICIQQNLHTTRYFKRSPKDHSNILVVTTNYQGKLKKTLRYSVTEKKLQVF